MHIEPLAGSLGAQITGVDIAHALEDSAFRAVRDALVRYGVIVIRDQHLSAQQHLQFVKRFGPIHFHPHVSGLPQHPEIMEILKTENETINFGSQWHTDQSFLEQPAMATCLYAREIPDAGGDTLFACLRNGYRTLSIGMQRLVRSLDTVNLSVAAQLAQAGSHNASTYASMRARDAQLDEPAAQHPLVRRHPISGEPALYIGLHTQHFVGMSIEESRPLTDFLIAHITRPDNTCRLRWTPGSVAIWDNCSVLHNAINDYPGKRRRMHRITVAGERPIAYRDDAHPIGFRT